MKRLLEYILSIIVQNPKEISVEEKIENNNFNFLIRVHPDDVKIVIGKNGQTIKALKELVKIKAAKEGKGINLTIAQ